MLVFIKSGEVVHLTIVPEAGHYAREITLDQGACLNLDYRVLGLTDWQENCTIHLKGEGARVKIRGVMRGEHHAKLAYRLILEHTASYTESEIEFRGVAEGESHLIFDGLIKVPQGVKGIVAEEQNRNLILSNAAQIESRPRLEIDSDEVACRHGSTISDLDENELFYLQSRGVPEGEARRLLIEAFLGFFL